MTSGSGTLADEIARPFASWITQVRASLHAVQPRRLAPTDARQAAVLVPLYVNAGGLWTLLTKRAEHLPHHKGQIAFPGGSLEPGEDNWQAALRETHEEVGIDPKTVLELGQLDESETPSGFRIVPCVGAVPFPLQTEINRGEIDELFPVPLSAFADPTMVEERVVTFDSRPRQIRVYHVAGRQVWGLTARIVQNLLVRLGLEAEPEPS